MNFAYCTHRVFYRMRVVLFVLFFLLPVVAVVVLLFCLESEHSGRRALE